MTVAGVQMVPTQMGCSVTRGACSTFAAASGFDPCAPVLLSVTGTCEHEPARQTSTHAVAVAVAPYGPASDDLLYEQRTTSLLMVLHRFGAITASSTALVTTIALVSVVSTLSGMTPPSMSTLL